MLVWLLKFQRRARTFGLIFAVFLVACGAGYLVVRDAVTRTVERQSIAIAEIVASQATTARSVYAAEIAEKLRRDGFGPRVDFTDWPGHVPIPAQFLRMVGAASSLNAGRLYEYKPVSRWNLGDGQGLSDDFLRWAWPQLEMQDLPAPTGPTAWKPIYRFEVSDGERVLRLLAADPASQASCVQCHNAYEKTPAILALRQANGNAVSKEWKQHQLMGALSITIPLVKANDWAGAQINQTSFFVFGILVASLFSMLWFNWRLAKRELRLIESEAQLSKAELTARAANDMLAAKHGVEQALAKLSTYVQAIDQHAIVSVVDLQGRILRVNDKFVEVSGYRSDELLGQNHRIINSGTHSREFFQGLWATIAAGKIWRGVICNRKKSGDLYWVDSAIVPLKSPDGHVVEYISIRIDITERKRAEEEILHLATHDQLTGLVTRALLHDRVRQAIEKDRRVGDLAAVFFIDLDQFKGVNDSLGHAAGDQLLIEISNRLTGCVRTEDTVARQGGDEFIVFLPRVPDAYSVRVFAENLLKVIAEPVQINGMNLHIGASIGVALYPHDGKTVEDLLKKSDVAMYSVKESGRNSFLFFKEYMDLKAAERFTLVSDLRRAALDDELFLMYQPIVGIASGEIESMEVLVRWQHPVLGLLPPTQFIPLAESSGLILGLGDWIIQHACEQWSCWQRAGLQMPRMALNLSPLQLQHGSIVERLTAILAATGMDASQIELEITETSLMNQNEDMVRKLDELSAMGFSIAIDDFGTGYSSLSHLKRFPIDTLKIDRMFVGDIERNDDDAAIVSTVIAMARSLKMQVVAEGVETPAQLAYLRDLGCQFYQGFLFSKPLAADDMARRLRPASPDA